MNNLRNEIMLMRIQLNSSYGMGSVGTSLYDDLLKKKNRYFKILNRILKIKGLYE